jgi:protocatechuate 3,4-dioxygenase beta subunit
MRMRLLFAMIASLIPVFAQAQEVLLPPCIATNRVATVNYPGAKAIHPSNNLLLAAGKSIPAEGQVLILQGQVLDVHCKPVPEATVELWQNNPFGRWLRATDEDLATPYPVFTGSGRTYTDRDGRFIFTTAFPAPLKDRAPFINMRVKARTMPEHTTMLFFANDARNGSDGVFRKLNPKTQEDVTIEMGQGAEGELIGLVTFVLPALAPYRTY